MWAPDATDSREILSSTGRKELLHCFTELYLLSIFLPFRWDSLGASWWPQGEPKSLCWCMMLQGLQELIKTDFGWRRHKKNHALGLMKAALALLWPPPLLHIKKSNNVQGHALPWNGNTYCWWDESLEISIAQQERRHPKSTGVCWALPVSLLLRNTSLSCLVSRDCRLVSRFTVMHFSLYPWEKGHCRKCYGLVYGRGQWQRTVEGCSLLVLLPSPQDHSELTLIRLLLFWLRVQS